MSKSEKPLPIRQSDDGKWEVRDASGNWIKCETEEDAKILSNARIVRTKLDKAAIPDKVLAAEFDNTAEVLDKYNWRTTARYFRAMAKRARGKSS